MSQLCLDQCSHPRTSAYQAARLLQQSVFHLGQLGGRSRVSTATPIKEQLWLGEGVAPVQLPDKHGGVNASGGGEEGVLSLPAEWGKPSTDQLSPPSPTSPLPPPALTLLSFPVFLWSNQKDIEDQSQGPKHVWKAPFP